MGPTVAPARRDPAGPRTRRGKRDRSHRRHRTGRKPRTRHRSNVAAETASATQTSRWGVHDNDDREVGPAQACRSAAVTGQPLAKPSTNCGVPRSTECAPAGAPGPGVATACQPLFRLWPEHELERLGRAGHLGRRAVDVRRGLRDVGTGPRLGGRERRRPGGRRRRGRAHAAAGGRVERELVEVPPGARRRRAGARRVVPDGRLHDVGAGRQRDALGVGPAGHHLDLAAVERRRRRADDRDVDRLAVDGQQVAHAVAGQLRRRGADDDAGGEADLRDRRTAGPADRPSSSSPRTRAGCR